MVELGVRPSSTYLANATIWVEGVSDHAYLRAYMEAFLCYLKSRGGKWGEPLAGRLGQYREDRHYAFVEYNGSNFPHFILVEESADASDQHNDPGQVATIRAPSLCAQAIVLADRDIESKGGGKREKLFVDHLGDRFIKLSGKEIENLVPPELLKEQIEFDLGSNLSTASLEAVDYVVYPIQGKEWEATLAVLALKYTPLLALAMKPPSLSQELCLPTTRLAGEAIPRAFLIVSGRASEGPESMPVNRLNVRDSIFLCLITSRKTLSDCAWWFLLMLQRPITTGMLRPS
jgi:hypothetical protein